jgi:uncharacterized protein YdaU (DUF1376 family)
MLTPAKKYEPSPWFAFYPQDFLGGTADFTCEEVGIYVRLLCYQWIKGVSADRVDLLAGRFQNPRSLPAVLKKFRKIGDRLVNHRLESVRREKDSFRQKQTAKALLRWQCHGNATAMPMDMPQSPSPSPSHKSNSIDVNNPSFAALRIANRIIANETGWHYDNCKVKPSELKSASLQTVIFPFAGQLSEKQILSCWATAARQAHAARVDKLATHATPYAVECFKRLLQGKVKP